MARLNIVGGETGDASETYNGTLSGSGGISLVSANVRTGTYAYRVNAVASNVATQAFRGLSSNGTPADWAKATVYHRIYYRFATIPASGEEEIYFVFGNGTGGDLSFSLRITSAGILKLYKGDFSGVQTLVATGSTAISTGQYVRIEIQTGTGASAAYEVRINGATEFSGTTTMSTATQWNYCQIGKSVNRNNQSIDFNFDDCAWDDATWPGAGEVRCLKTRAAGSSAQWTTGTGSTFTEVDEVPHDSDTTYIKNSTNGNASSFAMDSSSTGGVTGTIQSVKTIAIVRDEGGVSSIKVRLRNGTTNRDTTGADPGASYVAFGRIDTTDPNTGAAWTSSGLDTIECGVVNGASVAARCTAIYAMVECTGSTSVTVTPGTATLTLTGYAPTVTRTWTDTLVTPGVASLTLTGYAPTVTTSQTQKWVATKVLSAASTNGCVLKASSGIVGPITLINTSGAVRYLHLYDATSVVVGTTVPAFTIEIPAGTLRWGTDNGITFSTGICYSLTTGAGDSDTGAVGANEITGVICWY